MDVTEILIARFADTLAAAGCTDRTIENCRYSVRGFARFVAPRALTKATADFCSRFLRHVLPPRFVRIRRSAS